MTKECDVQNYLYDNLSELPDYLWISVLEESLKPTREDLLFSPLKYLLYKKYQHIFSKMWCFDSFHKFSKEYVTWEYEKSRPRIDILAYNWDPSTFFITEVKWRDKAERETITELLQYANGLQINDFPWLSNDDIVFVIVANDWSNILIQSVINWMLFKSLNILPLIVAEWQKNKFDFKFYDLWDTEIIKNIDKEIYNEKNYSNRVLAFDESKYLGSAIGLEVNYNDMKTITMMHAVECSQRWLTGYILWMEAESNMMYKNSISIIQFNPFNFETKNWKSFPKKKQVELMEFSDNYNDCSIDTQWLRNIIKFHFPKNNIRFEEGGAGNNWLSSLNEQHLLFSYWYPVWFLYTLIFDLIIYCREDKYFSCLITESDEIDQYDQISHWMYLSGLFEIHKSWATNLEEYEQYYLTS